jgi:cytoskeletal protein RodZ
MKTIGQILKEARVKKRYSLGKMEEATKIKADFIGNIEKGNYQGLPAFSTTLGFVKSIAKTLGVEESMAVAIFKRDYPPKVQAIVPKPDVGKKFVWGPKLTFTIGVWLIIALVLGYLIVQYVKFLSPPSLEVIAPKENEVVSSLTLNVSGKTNSDAKVIINNQPAIVDDNGSFSTTLDVNSETKEINVVATSRSGKVTQIKRNISVNPN